MTVEGTFDGELLFIGQISPNISAMPNGYIVCHDVPIAKAGIMTYRASELTGKDGKPLVTPDANGLVHIETTPESLRDPLTLASFEGMDVTIRHPRGPDGRPTLVNPDNFERVTAGHVLNVRNGTVMENGRACDAILADLMIKKRGAIVDVRSKRLRQVSSGYNGKYTTVRPGYGTCDFRVGNHVALVESGRAGPECTISDSATQETTMSTQNQTSLATRIARFLGLGLSADAAATAAVAEETAAAASPTAGLAAVVDQALAPLVARLAALEQKGGTPAAPAAPTADEGLRKDVATLATAVSGLVTKIEGMGQMAQCTDQETISRAEILAPGCAKTANCRVASLAACYATADGKVEIDRLLAGRAFDANDNVLFVAASEVMKVKRTQALAAVADAARQNGAAAAQNGQPKKAPTAEDVNKANAEFYGQTRIH